MIALEIAERDARRRRRRNLEHARNLARVLIGHDVGRDLLVVDERAIEARRLAVRDQVGGEIELGIVSGKHRWRMPREIQARQLDAILEHQPTHRPTAVHAP